tara:strand:- start:26 stop:160 length:135 start_codon:yes stop_codon:yes gene_type:complete
VAKNNILWDIKAQRKEKLFGRLETNKKVKRKSVKQKRKNNTGPV